MLGLNQTAPSEDDTRRSFLDALDEKMDVDITDWEAMFMDSNQHTTSFSEAQRVSIDRMIKKYGHRVSY